jgi:predicted short-subunit dehydrogenase-like oxidoreductase (DUF2520 family)
VATHISRHLFSAGHRIGCIWSRTAEKAKSLAAEVKSQALSHEEALPEDADIYLMAVSDKAIGELARRFSGRNGIWIHTAGAVGLDVLSEHFEHCGVLYPLQTLSRDRGLSPARIPFLVEASDTPTFGKMTSLVSGISARWAPADSAQRLQIHLAAVFANNFTNHMMHIGLKLMEDSGHDPALLQPILKETFAKIRDLGPAIAQTGPARRGDEATMDKHRELLKDHPEWEKLYTFISRSIRNEQL